MKLVAPPERDHRQLRRDRVDQLGAGGRAAAVVRHLEHVRRDDLTGIAAPGQLTLAVGLQIAREQNAAPRERDAQHQRRVVHAQPVGRVDRVRAPPGSLSNGPGGRRVALPRQRGRRLRGIGDAALARERDEPPVLGVVPVVAAGPERADVEAFQDAEQTVQVIGVRMRQRDDFDPADAARAQEWFDDARARIERAVAYAAAVDHHHRATGRLDDRGVTLSDVQERHRQIACAPPGEVADREAAERDQRRRERRPRQRPARGPGAAGRYQREASGTGQRRGLEQVRRPAQPERAVGAESARDRQRPLRREARGGQGQLAQRRPQRTGGRAREAHGHHRQFDDRNQGQVAERRQRRDLAEVVGHQRRGRRRGSDRRRHEAPQPRERAPRVARLDSHRARADTACAQRDADDGRERQLQRRIGQLQRTAGQQHQRRCRDGRRRRRAPTDQVRAHADRQHESRPQRRDRLAGHQREQRDRGQRHRGRHSARIDVERQPRHARRRRSDDEEQQRRDGRQVQPRHRQDVRRARDAEAFLDVGADAAPIAQHGGLEERRRVAAHLAIDRGAQRAPDEEGDPPGTGAGRLGEARDRAGVGDARQRIDAGRAHRQRRIGKAWVAGAVQLVEARPEGDPLAGPEIGPAVDDGQRQRARRRRARDPRQRDDQACTRARALRPARDRPLDLLGVVALRTPPPARDPPGPAAGRAFPAARPPRRTRRGRRPPPDGRARARSPPPRSARTRRPSASRARQPARRHRPRRRRCTTRRAARVMFGAARVRLPGPRFRRRDQYQLKPTMKARLLRSPPS